MMPMGRVFTGKRLTVLVAGVCALMAALVMWTRLNRVTFENDPIAYSIMVSAPVYATLPRAPAGDTAALLGALDAAVVTGLSGDPAGADPARLVHAALLPAEIRPGIGSVSLEMHRALQEQVARLVEARFAPGNTSEYLRVRALDGAELPDKDGFAVRNYSTLAEVVRFQLGREPTPADSVRSLFDYMFLKNRTADAGWFNLEQFATGDGVAVAYGVHDGNHSTAALDATRLGPEGWYGAISHTYWVWTVPDQTAGQLVERHGILPSAQVGIVMYFEQGGPRPHLMTFIWNPDRQGWQLEHVSINNHVPAKGVDGAPVF